MIPPRTLVDLAVLKRRIRIAQGLEPGDLLLTGGKVVNVFTQRVEAANVVIADGWIAGVGNFSWTAKQTIDLAGQFVVPGFIDSHMHLESTLLTPGELARLIVPMGTLATISDSHEIGNVLGIPGIDLLLSASQGLPLDLFMTASSCVPATDRENAGAVLGPREVGELLDRPRVLGLAEVMDIPAVMAGETGVLEKIRAGMASGKILDGHAPGMGGLTLQAYAAAGIRSDHESATVEEARAKAALGMLVQVREGSAARNLDALLPLLVAGELGDFWSLVTDDIFPTDLRAHGHIDGILRRVIAAGVEPANAIRHATLIPARHYGLVDRGAVAPSYRADLVVIDNLRNIKPTLVFKSGQLVARDGTFVGEAANAAIPHGNTVHLAPLDETAFHLRPKQATCPVIRIIPGQLLTSRETRTVRTTQGQWTFDPNEDVALVASLERHRATGNIGLALISGFNFKKHGALGSSVAHDSHNLIVAGTNPQDMLACVRALEKTGGGFVAASGGTVTAQLPLSIAGLLSTESADLVCEQLNAVNAAALALGCELEAPFGTLSFQALPVIPDLRVTDRGLFDVVKQELVAL